MHRCAQRKIPFFALRNEILEFTHAHAALDAAPVFPDQRDDLADFGGRRRYRAAAGGQRLDVVLDEKLLPAGTREVSFEIRIGRKYPGSRREFAASRIPLRQVMAVPEVCR